VIELYILSDCEYKVKTYGVNNIKFSSSKLTSQVVGYRILQRSYLEQYMYVMLPLSYCHYINVYKQLPLQNIFSSVHMSMFPGYWISSIFEN
jgi:hypothetical protein